MISPELLRRYPYFAGVSDATLKEVAMAAEETTVSAGHEMFVEGTPASKLFVIVRGEVNIEYVLGTGERKVVDTLVGGDLLCWSAIIEPYNTTACGSTVKDTDLISIDAAKLRSICDQDPLVGYQLTIQVAKLLAHRLEGARVQLAAVG